MEAPNPSPPGVDSVVARVIPGIFGLIGVTVVVFLWAQPFGAWDSPPLFFRIFGSLIGAVFILLGFRGAFGPPLGGRGASRGASRRRPGVEPHEEPPRAGYECPNCGGGLGSDTEVSPSGDVKCTFCDRWFNIHRLG